MLKTPLPLRRVTTSHGELSVIDRPATTADGRDALVRPDATVVLVHGLPTCKELWSDVIRALPSRWRVVAPDLPGFGQSSPTPGPITHAERAAALHELFDALGLDQDVPFDVVGHDLGASVVVQYLGDFGTRAITRVILMSPPVWPDFRKPWRVSLLRLPLVGELFAPIAKPILLSRTVRQGMAHPDRYGGGFALALQEAWGGPGGTRAVLRALRWGDPPTTFAPYPATLRALDRPLLVVQGRQDPWIPAEHAERLASEVPDATLVWIADGGHFLPVDVPEQVAAAMVDFLA